jgi:hypothetical protein
VDWNVRPGFIRERFFADSWYSNHGVLGATQPQPNGKLDTEKERTELTTEYTEHTERELFRVFRVFRGKTYKRLFSWFCVICGIIEGPLREKNRKFLAALVSVPAVEVKPLMEMAPWISC